MRRELLNSLFRPMARLRLLALAALAVSIGLGGCVYRMDIQQGNYLEGKTVNQLKVGMTRSQVRYLLGTPMVEDVFDTDRWDYVYYYKRGYVRRPIESRVIVYFSGDKVQRLALYNVPKGRPQGPNRLAPVTKFSIF
ncbi:MAG: outer membrane protein assembly factor BamE [Steroidobacteraceae bacterium]